VKKTVLLSMGVVSAIIANLTLPVMAAEDTATSIASVTINEIVSVTLADPSPDGVNFGSVNDGTTGNPDLDNDSAAGYAIQVQVGSETNVNVSVNIKGENFTNGSGGTIYISNAYFSTFNEFGGANTMETSYKYVGSVSAGGGNVDVFHWLDVPDGTAPGTYQSTFTYQATT